MSEVTVDDLRAAKMEGTLFLDGKGFHENHFRCVQYPELTKISSSKTEKGKRIYKISIFVDGMEVAQNYDKIVAAINAFRAVHTGATP